MATASAGTVWVDVKPRFDADGFDLLAEIRRIVREEIRAALGHEDAS